MLLLLDGIGIISSSEGSSEREGTGAVADKRAMSIRRKENIKAIIAIVQIPAVLNLDIVAVLLSAVAYNTIHREPPPARSPLRLRFSLPPEPCDSPLAARPPDGKGREAACRCRRNIRTTS